MALTPEARGEIVEEAKRRALKDMGKPVSELTSEEKRQAGSLANDYAVQMLKDAHDFKLRLADLDADKYAFEKVFAGDLQNTPYAQNLNDDANLEEEGANEAGVQDVEEDVPSLDWFWELARQSEKNAINYPSFAIGGKKYAVGYFDSKGNHLDTANEYNGDYGVMVYWRNENGKAERKFIPFNPFRERLESETSEDWNREYVDYNGKVLRDAVLMDREQGNGLNIQKGFSEDELTQRFNKPPKKGKIAQKLLDRISEFLEEVRGRSLNEEQRGILDVVRGDKKYYHLRADDLGNVISFLRSSRERNGVNHILLKHYGKNSQMGYVSAEEILNIGNIIRNGEVNIVSDFKREYTMRDPKDKNRILTVVVTKSQKKKQPDFVYTFYSNKKEAEENAGAVARRDTSLPSYISSADSEQSENFSENQEENAKYSKNFDENAENADLGGDLPQGKGEPLVFKPILKPKLPLPKRFREGKVAGIGDIRRWVSEAMGINVNLEADAGADYNGVYTTPSDTIHLRSDNINSPRVLLIPSSLVAAVSTRIALVVLRRF